MHTSCEVPGLPSAYPSYTLKQDRAQTCDELLAYKVALVISSPMPRSYPENVSTTTINHPLSRGNPLIKCLLDQSYELRIRSRKSQEFVMICNRLLPIAVFDVLRNTKRLCEASIAFRDGAFVGALRLLGGLATRRV